MRGFTAFVTKGIGFLKKSAAPVALFVLFSFSLMAQKPDNIGEGGNITGRVIDSLSGQPIDYATISLIGQDSQKPVNGTTTENTGVFKMTNVAEGKYQMQVYFIGYQTSVRNNIVISKTNNHASVGDIKLVNSQTTLGAVTVTAEKSVIENKMENLRSWC